MVSADSAAKSQLLFMIEKIDGEYTLCGCSRVDYLDCEHYMNQSWMPADLGEPKAVKTWLLAFLYVINGRVQKGEASLSCCTNSSSNLVSYCWH